MDERTENLFNKLVRLHRRDEELLRALERVAAAGEDYQRAAGELEDLAGREGATAPAADAPPPAPLTDDEWREIQRKLSASAQLRELFAAGPLLSDPTDARTFALLAGMADVKPDPRTMLAARDSVFMGTLDAVLRRNLTDPAQLTLDYLEKFLSLYRSDAGLVKRLAALAAAPARWAVVLALIEDNADYTGGDRQAASDLADLNKLVTPDLRDKLAAPVPLSRVPPELFALAWSFQDDLDEARKALQDFNDRSWASAALQRLRATPAAASALDAVEATSRLRVEVARHLVAVRRFAKLNALVDHWPEAARLALTNYTSLTDVESLVRDRVAGQSTQAAPNFSSEEARRLYEMALQNESLEKFLRLRPYFSEIRESELATYRPAAPIQMAQAVVEQTPATKAAPAAEQTPATDKPAKEAEAATPAELETYVCKLALSAITTPESEMRLPQDVNSYNFVVEVMSPSWVDKDHVQVIHPNKLITHLLADLGIRDASEPQVNLTRMFAPQGTDYAFRLVRAGERLFKSFLGGAFGPEKDSRKLLHAERRVRLLIETGDTTLASLPWEWLAVPGAGETFIQSDRHSLVRSFPRPGEPPTGRPLTLPLRVLVVAPAMEAASKVEALRDVIRSAMGAEVNFLTGIEASVENVKDALFEFMPHILHYEGIVSLDFAGNTRQRVINLASSASGPPRLNESQLQELLPPAGVQLMVFGSNYAGIEAENHLLNLIGVLTTGTLPGLEKESGGPAVLPAALAPMRQVEEGAAIGFLRDFYRYLFSPSQPGGGMTQLEAAVVKARQGQRGKGGDWTAFTLFADLGTLRSWEPFTGA